MPTQPILFGTQVMLPFIASTNTNPILNVNGATFSTVDNGAPGINSGPAAGEVLSEKGNAFLGPNQILSTIDVFSNSIGAGGLLQNNPNPLEVAQTTQNGISAIFGTNFVPSTVQVPLLNLPLALPIPDITQDPSAGQLNLASLFVTNLIKSLNNPASAPATTISAAGDIGPALKTPFSGVLNLPAFDTTGAGTTTNNGASGIDNSSLAPSSLNLLQLGNLLPSIFTTVASGTNGQNQLNTIPGLTSTANGNINPGTNGLLGFGSYIPNTIGMPVAPGTNTQTQVNTIPGAISTANGTIAPASTGLLNLGTSILSQFGSPVPTDPGATRQIV